VQVHFDPTAFLADPELLSELEKAAAKIDCPDDRALFHQGDPALGLYIVRDGTATVTLKSESDSTIMKVDVSAGSLLGLPGVLGNQPYSLTAVAHKGAKVSFVGIKDFSALMETHPTLSLKVLQVLAAEVRTARRALYE
jgi:CRP-like cAMP-binding protein